MTPSTKIAIVLGSSAAALDELAAARAFLDVQALPLALVCVNDSIKVAPVKPVAFCTIHSRNMPDRFITPDIDIEGVKMFTRRGAHGFSSYVVRAKWLGTSGLYAVQIALEELKYDGVILAGVPMNAGAGTNYGREVWADDDFVSRMRPEWLKALPVIGPRVRSMSGWTRELLGAPDSPWLDALDKAPATV